MTASTKTAQKIANAIGTTVVPLEGKRPMLLDRLLTKGAEVMGLVVTPERLARMRDAVGERVVEELGELDALRSENLTLRTRVAALETRVATDGATMTEAEMGRMRTLVSYGLQRKAAADLFDVPEAVVKAVLEGKGQVRIVPPRPRGRPSSKGRALDL